MIVSVMQPTYLPWLGYFDLIDSSDAFVFLDDVKLEKSDWHVRNRIKGANGELMLTCPVATPSGRMEAKINSTVFAKGHPWRKKHLKSIEACYRKTPFFDELFLKLSNYYLASHNELLGQFNIGLIKLLCDYLSISSQFFAASELSGITGTKDHRLVSICQKLKANNYLSPLGAKAYIEQEQPGGQLAENGIEVFYQNFEHPHYQQLFGPFISHLGVIDCLFNVGPEQTLTLIRQGHNPAIHYRDISKL